MLYLSFLSFFWIKILCYIDYSKCTHDCIYIAESFAGYCCLQIKFGYCNNLSSLILFLYSFEIFFLVFINVCRNDWKLMQWTKCHMRENVQVHFQHFNPNILNKLLKASIIVSVPHLKLQSIIKDLSIQESI